MLKLNVEGLGPGRPATARGDGTGGAGMTGQTQQDWAEMETRMHYLETQAEEAAAALARKHAEHAALVHRAETAEGKVEAAEKAAKAEKAASGEKPASEGSASKKHQRKHDYEPSKHVSR